MSLNHIIISDITRIQPISESYGTYLTAPKLLTSLKGDLEAGTIISRFKFTTEVGCAFEEVRKSMAYKAHVKTVILTMGLFALLNEEKNSHIPNDREDLSNLCSLMDELFPCSNKIILCQYDQRNLLENRLKSLFRGTPLTPKVVVHETVSGMVRVFRGHLPIVNYNTVNTWVQKEVLI
jgi:hypothetical protein